jgi:hypothetical protein
MAYGLRDDNLLLWLDVWQYIVICHAARQYKQEQALA